MHVKLKRQAIDRWIGERNEALFELDELQGKAKPPTEPTYTPGQKKATESIISQLQNTLNEDNKSASLKKFKSLFNQLDQDTVEGYDDVESAIEEYEGIERSGMTPEEYADEKSSAFEAIQEAVDGLELIEEENEPVEMSAALSYEKELSNAKT